MQGSDHPGLGGHTGILNLQTQAVVTGKEGRDGSPRSYT